MLFRSRVILQPCYWGTRWCSVIKSRLNESIERLGRYSWESTSRSTNIVLSGSHEIGFPFANGLNSWCNVIKSRWERYYGLRLPIESVHDKPRVWEDVRATRRSREDHFESKMSQRSQIKSPHTDDVIVSQALKKRETNICTIKFSPLCKRNKEWSWERFR